MWLESVWSYMILMFCVCLKRHLSLGLLLWVQDVQGWLEIIKLTVFVRLKNGNAMWLSELMNKGIAFAFTATQTCRRLPQPSYRKHLPWRKTNLLVLNSQPQVCKPANPRQIISKINSFSEELRGVGHSRIWFPMICLEQIGTSRTCNESQ